MVTATTKKAFVKSVISTYIESLDVTEYEFQQIMDIFYIYTNFSVSDKGYWLSYIPNTKEEIIEDFLYVFKDNLRRDIRLI